MLLVLALQGETESTPAAHDATVSLGLFWITNLWMHMTLSLGVGFPRTMFGLDGKLEWHIFMYMLLSLRCGHEFVSGILLITLDTAKLGFKRSGWPTYSHFTSSCVHSKRAAVCARKMSSCVRSKQVLLCAHLEMVRSPTEAGHVV